MKKTGREGQEKNEKGQWRLQSFQAVVVPLYLKSLLNLLPSENSTWGMLKKAKIAWTPGKESQEKKRGNKAEIAHPPKLLLSNNSMRTAVNFHQNHYHPMPEDQNTTQDSIPTHCQNINLQQTIKKKGANKAQSGDFRRSACSENQLSETMKISPCKTKDHWGHHPLPTHQWRQSNCNYTRD